MCTENLYMLRWRNWRLKYIGLGVQDRSLKLCPGQKKHGGCRDIASAIYFDLSFAFFEVLVQFNPFTPSPFFGQVQKFFLDDL